MRPFFTWMFLVFMGFMSIHRFWQTFSRAGIEKGQIIKGWTLPVLSFLHILVGTVTVIEYFWLERPINSYVTLTGLILFSVAFLGRAWAVKTLGKYHSSHIEIRRNQSLIKNGPYRYVRHPYYLCVMLELVGLPLIPNSYYAFLIALFGYIPMVGIRLFFEERELLKKFGEEYEEYRRRVACVIPFLK